MMNLKSLLKSAKLATFVHHQCESESIEVLKELSSFTASMPNAQMQISADQGDFLSFLVRILSAKKIIEIGTFTGYSSLCMALALPDDAKLIACDINDDWMKIAIKFWKKAKVDHKISVKLAPALETIELLSKDVDNLSSFDLAFIDADKLNNYNYYNNLLPLIKLNGVIVLDNALPGDHKTGEFKNDKNRIELIEKIKQDNRSITNLFTIGAGFLVITKIK
ncbi:MAG: class I SAM-dependent methyltransferase [SAR324 cluster bacterium]|nr:class I SAM-dependent methyltransferase [SAR324 cluster bacterium]